MTAMEYDGNAYTITSTYHDSLPIASWAIENAEPSRLPTRVNAHIAWLMEASAIGRCLHEYLRTLPQRSRQSWSHPLFEILELLDYHHVITARLLEQYTV